MHIATIFISIALLFEILTEYVLCTVRYCVQKPNKIQTTADTTHISTKLWPAIPFIYLINACIQQHKYKLYAEVFNTCANEMQTQLLSQVKEFDDL